MDSFEGYVGIQMWYEQFVDDVIFSLLLGMGMVFAYVFHSNYHLFAKMLKDVVQVKERTSLFEDVTGNEFVFRNFMTFQALFLCIFSIHAIGRGKDVFFFPDLRTNLTILLLLFLVILGFYSIKRALYFVMGFVFLERDKYESWKTGYNAITGLWGVLLYIPVFWLVFVGKHIDIPLYLFVFLYLAYRFLIIIKSIQIFHISAGGFFYIFLYLCTQEILPLIFLFKGVDYLYNVIEKSALWH